MDTNSLLLPENDPMGNAIKDYFIKGKASRLRVFSSQFDEDEMPVSTLFREADAMPETERKALDSVYGRVLDVGAGAGCHALALQKSGVEVEAIDISPLSVEVMQARGVKHVRQADLFDETWCGQYDTVLMLMNGSGIIGTLDRMPQFFRRMKSLLAEGGQILMDSSDLRYVFEDEDGGMDIDLNARYYGEIDFRMKYKNIEGKTFDWLYVDFDTLAYHAQQNGFHAEKMMDGLHYDYLARLTVAANGRQQDEK